MIAGHILFLHQVKEVGVVRVTLFQGEFALQADRAVGIDIPYPVPVDEQIGRFSEFEQPLHVVVMQSEIQGDDNRPTFQDCQVGNRPLGTVFPADSNLVTFPDAASFHQIIADLADFFLYLRIRIVFPLWKNRGETGVARKSFA